MLLCLGAHGSMMSSTVSMIDLVCYSGYKYIGLTINCIVGVAIGKVVRRLTLCHTHPAAVRPHGRETYPSRSVHRQHAAVSSHRADMTGPADAAPRPLWDDTVDTKAVAATVGCAGRGLWIRVVTRGACWPRVRAVCVARRTMRRCSARRACLDTS